MIRAVALARGLDRSEVSVTEQAVTHDYSRKADPLGPRGHFARGQRMSCVQRNSASVRPFDASVTTASHTCVVLPRCDGVATQVRRPSRAVPRKLVFSSIVVKFSAPGGR